MDEKTERLREIFLAVSDGAELTERQSAARGSLAEDDVDDAELEALVGSMRERYEFATELDDEELSRVARGFYAGETDTAIGRALGDVSAGTVRRARQDLHLVADGDLDAPFDLDALRRLRNEGASTAEKAEALDVSPSTVRKYGRALEAQARRRLVGDRFREEFDRLLGDGELSERLTAGIRETGLREATEDMETNVSF
ncbi:MAG: conditioned medium-induced protein 4 [Halobacteriales archaeon]|nr:conditioned medium-induced protein 4 [Halobacteriales archaeon]